MRLRAYSSGFPARDQARGTTIFADGETRGVGPECGARDVFSKTRSSPPWPDMTRRPLSLFRGRRRTYVSSVVSAGRSFFELQGAAACPPWETWCVGGAAAECARARRGRAHFGDKQLVSFMRPRALRVRSSEKYDPPNSVRREDHPWGEGWWWSHMSERFIFPLRPPTAPQLLQAPGEALATRLTHTL